MLGYGQTGISPEAIGPVELAVIDIGAGLNAAVAGSLVSYQLALP